MEKNWIVMGFVLKGVFAAPRVRGCERTIRECEADWRVLTWSQIGRNDLMRPKARGKAYRKWIDWCQRRESRNWSQDQERWIEKDGARCEPDAAGVRADFGFNPSEHDHDQEGSRSFWMVGSKICLLKSHRSTLWPAALNLPSRIWSALEPAVRGHDQKNMNRRSLLWTIPPFLKRPVHSPLVRF